MIPVRMKKRKMFLRVAQSGIKVVAGGMVVQASLNGLDVPRVGFTVTKKVGGAVVRNRIRRRLRELVRTYPLMAEVGGIDLVIIGRLSTKDRPYEKLKADLVYAICEVKRLLAERETQCDISSDS